MEELKDKILENINKIRENTLNLSNNPEVLQNFFETSLFITNFMNTSLFSTGNQVLGQKGLECILKYMILIEQESCK